METIFNTINELQNTYETFNQFEIILGILAFMIMPHITFSYDLWRLQDEINKLKRNNNIDKNKKKDYN